MRVPESPIFLVLCALVPERVEWSRLQIDTAVLSMVVYCCSLVGKMVGEEQGLKWSSHTLSLGRDAGHLERDADERKAGVVRITVLEMTREDIIVAMR